MNKALPSAVIGAVLYLLVLTWIMFSGRIQVDVDMAPKGLADWSIPAYAIPAEQLGKNVASLSNPFLLRFFEQVSLKGFVRNSQGTWSGIFQGPTGSPKILAPGAGFEGVTLLEADGRKCKIRCGTAIRELSMGSKNAAGQTAR